MSSMRERIAVYTTDAIDLVLFHVLRDVKDGIYVDVGANDPWSESVTKLFYDRGWSGINIEPQEKYLGLLQADRPRDVNLCLGAGDREAELELYGEGGLATMDRSLASGGRGATKVKVLPLTRILDDNLRPGSEIHFCKIDVEGFEKQVLDGLDLTKYRPWVFSIESTIPNSGAPSFGKWEHILTDNGYVLAFNGVGNRYYVDEKYASLKNGFVPKDRLTEIYDTFFVSRDPFEVPSSWGYIKSFLWRVLRKIRYP